MAASEVSSWIKGACKEAEATDVLAALVQAHDEDGTRLTDDELFSQTFFLYAAGHVTTSTALTWTIFLLHQHPRIHADLLAELDGTLHGEVPTFASLQHGLLDSRRWQPMLWHL